VTAPPRPVRVVARKWPDRPHWEFDGLHLGADEHGQWVGAPAGTRMTRPGAAFTTDQDIVTLLPHGEPFVATFYAPGGSVPCDLYVDIATPPTWSGDRVSSVDLDLDVVRGWSGRVWVDDEDEFAEHRVRWRYPEALVRLATRSCEAVRAAVHDRRPPYDADTARPWFAALERAIMAR
jgi:hypothetical protein